MFEQVLFKWVQQQFCEKCRIMDNKKDIYNLWVQYTTKASKKMLKNALKHYEQCF